MQAKLAISCPFAAFPGEAPVGFCELLSSLFFSWDSGDSWGSDYSSGYSSSYDDDSSGGGFGTMGLTILITMGIIIWIITRDGMKKMKQTAPKPGGAARTPQSSLKSMEEFKTLDPGYNEAALREHLSNLYVQMQECWHNKNIESLKPYFTDAFYNQSEHQLAAKRKQGQTPCTERVAVMEVNIRGFRQDSGMDHLIVTVRSRLVAYTLDDLTGKVISGDRNREKFMEYEWDICRKSGIITGKTDKMQSLSCPHCGAPININQTAKCPYCGSIITVNNEDWALNNIKGISQRTM